MICLPRLRFGPAGYPAEAKGKVEQVFSILTRSGLNALEYAAVHGLRAREDTAAEIGRLADQYDISMSLHAAYYISLASKSMETRERSKSRLKKALRFAPLMAVKRIVFHPGTRGGLPEEEAQVIVRDALNDVWEAAGAESGGAFLSPEIAGKIGAFGSEEEILRLCQELAFCIPTLDWAHLYARSQGKVNEKRSYLKVIDQFESELGKRFVDNMHFHVSGITYTERGESAHRPLGEHWGPDILPLVEIVREVGYSPTFISESPDPLKGALYVKFLFDELEKSEK